MAQNLTIYVTGATGFIASHIIQQLLTTTSHNVRGSVRSLANTGKYEFLTSMPNATERLKLYEADLLKPGSFDEGLKGVDVCMHTASPYTANVKDPQKELVDPAVEGTKEVLTACQENGVKQVILTSSVAAVAQAPKPGHTFTSDDWNNDSSLKVNPYYYSKKLAERWAWDYKEKTFELTSINPFMVFGPALSKTINTSVDILMMMATGKQPVVLSVSWGVVDVRDVAEAHIKAIMNEKAYSKRFLLSSGSMNMSQMAKTIKTHFPGYSVPSLKSPDWFAKVMSYTQPKFTGTFLRANIGKGDFVVDNTPSLNDLGLKYRDGEQTVVDTIKDLQKWGHLKEVPYVEGETAGKE